MKSVILLTLFCLCTPLAAQVGAKVDQIVIPKSFGTSLVLKHCEALEVKDDSIKVKHDDGSYVVPFNNLPPAWKKWIADRSAAADATEKKELDLALQNAKALMNDNPHWKTTPPPEGWEILRVRVISEWAGSLLADLLQSVPPGTPGATSTGYNSSGKTVVLSGILPKDSEDNQMFTVLAKKAELRRFQGKELQNYLVSRFEKGVAP
jgi:hypothetical protein